MYTCPVPLYLPMQFPDVVRHGRQGYFCQHILIPISVFVGTGLYLCPIYKNRFSRNLACPMEELCHLRQEPLGAGGKMQRPEPGESGMVRSRAPFQQVHKINIPFTFLFHGARRKASCRNTYVQSEFVEVSYIEN